MRGSGRGGLTRRNGILLSILLDPTGWRGIPNSR